MNPNNVSNLILTKNKTLEIEGELENCLRKIGKKHKIDYNRTNDYGQRHFSLTIVFDELNINAFDESNIKKIKTLYKEYVELRQKTRPLEREYDSDKKIADDMKMNVRRYNV